MAGAGRKLCFTPPWQYNVGYFLQNAHMKMGREVKLQLAHWQWCNLVNNVSKLGAQIYFAKPAIGMLDMVFAANGGLVRGNRCLISKFEASGRLGETHPYFHSLEELGFDCSIPNRTFEGQGDAMFSHDGKILWVGHGFRTDPLVHEEIATFFGMKPKSIWNANTQQFERSEHANPSLISLKLILPEFYHLDTCLCPLDGGHIMIYPKAFTKEGLDCIKDFAGHDNVIEVGDTDAKAFACNAISLNDKIVLNAATDDLKQKLFKKGYEVIESPMSEFLLSGGSTKCCVLHLNLKCDLELDEMAA